MSERFPLDFSAYDLPSPCYVVDERLIIRNLEILQSVARASGAKILLAQKAFSFYRLYPLIGRYLSGTTASSLYEAKLGREEMPNTETHIFSPAYREGDFGAVLELCDHLLFNSFAQLKRFGPLALAHPQKPSLGLRLNPECRTQKTTPLYDPCAPFSRLGVSPEQFKRALAEDPNALTALDGFHMHTLCEQNADDLLTTVKALEEHFGKYLGQAKWLNLGGGHHITRDDYDRAALIAEIRRLRARYACEIYLEPGEAVALNAGYLVSEVLDFVENGMTIAILDSSAECHMPDVLAMPYRPRVIGAGEAGEKPHCYRLSSATCLAGDVIGDYSFDHALRVGERLVFCDMAIYTMVKNNTFNGIALPSLVLLRADGGWERVKQFSYGNFKARL